MPGYRCEHCGRTCFTLIEGRCLECPAPSRPGDGLRLSILFGGLWVLVGLLWFIAGCHVYEEPSPCGRAHPGGGVSVNVRELAEQDGGE